MFLVVESDPECQSITLIVVQTERFRISGRLSEGFKSRSGNDSECSKTSGENERSEIFYLHMEICEFDDRRNQTGNAEMPLVRCVPNREDVIEDHVIN